MISYEPFWKTLKVKKITQYQLIKKHNFSTGQLSRIRAGQYMSTHTLDTLCEILDCQVNEIIVYVPDKK